MFKKFEPENLFQITCSDVVERFQILLFLFMIGLQNASADLNRVPEDQTAHKFPMFLKQAATILACELAIDSVKHCFIVKVRCQMSEERNGFSLDVCGGYGCSVPPRCLVVLPRLAFHLLTHSLVYPFTYSLTPRLPYLPSTAKV